MTMTIEVLIYSGDEVVARGEPIGDEPEDIIYCARVLWDEAGNGQWYQKRRAAFYVDDKLTAETYRRP
jgi:hypothetical protein